MNLGAFSLVYHGRTGFPIGILFFGDLWYNERKCANFRKNFLEAEGGEGKTSFSLSEAENERR